MSRRLHLSFASFGREFAAVTACAVLSLVAPRTASATTLASADFATYTAGNLVGQDGWQQYSTSTTLPLTVASGRVAWPGGATVNNEDAFLAFPAQVTQPLSGTTVLNFDMTLKVTAPSASGPSYFAALNTLTTSSTSSNFQNARIVALAQGSGFVFGARVNGQSGYPFAYGTQELTTGQDYALRAEINMVAGNANDFIDLYVGPDFDNLSLYATAGYTSGTVSDPLFGAMLLSQFGNGTSVIEAGVSVASMSVTQVVPEPSTVCLAAAAAAGLGLYSRIRRSSRSLAADSIRLPRLLSLLCAFGLVVVAGRANATTLYSSPLTAPPLNAGNLVGQDGWVAHSGAGTVPIQVGASGTTLAQGSGTREDANVAFTPISAGETYYFGFDVVVTGGSTATYFAHFKDTATDYTVRTFVAPPTSTGDFTFGLSPDGSSPAATWATDLTFGQKYRLVGAYTADTRINRLWVNPVSEASTSLSATDPAAAAVSGFSLRQAGGDSAQLITNVTVGNTFTAVVPEPSSIMLAGLGGLIAAGTFAARRRSIHN